MIIAIDPGNKQSAYCVMDGYKPIEHAKLDNELLIKELHRIGLEYDIERVVVEMIASYGMAVGREVFDTCVWIGRFMQYAEGYSMKTDRIYREEEKLDLCGTKKANDSNIRRALIDRFAVDDLKSGKGTKAHPDWFYGFRADEWMAYAVGVTWLDKEANHG